MSEEQIQFLLEASNLFQSKPYSNIRSHMLLCSKIVAGHANLKLPPQIWKKSKRCDYCYLPWSDGNYDVQVLPEHKPGKKLKVLFSKLNEGKQLTPLQESLVKRCHNGNKLILKCHSCHKSTKFLIEKPGKLNKEIFNEPTINPVLKKKRKKKKDVYAGLTPDFVGNLQKNNNTDEIQVLSVKSVEKTMANVTLQTPTIVSVDRSKHETFFSKLSPNIKKKKKVKQTNKVLNPFCDVKSKLKKLSAKEVSKILSKKKSTAKSSLKDFLSIL